jgi:ABC-type glycerol-3-phosphate transport system substrate-binding protein
MLLHRYNIRLRAYRAEFLGILRLAAAAALLFGLSAAVLAVDNPESSDARSLLYQFLRTDTYTDYLKRHEGAARPQSIISVQATSFVNQSNAELAVAVDLFGSGDVLTWLNDDGEVTWEVRIPESGLYSIGLRYLGLPGKNNRLEMRLLIDGEIPFESARRIILNKLWVDERGIVRDSRGNDMRTRCVELPQWQFNRLSDQEGKVNEPFTFFFSSGVHQITLSVQKGNFAIDEISLSNDHASEPYAMIKAGYKRNAYAPTSNHLIKIEGERPILRSDPILQPQSDASGPATSPSDPVKIRMNTVGGYNWQYPHQWITWEFEVPESGLYNIATRARQTYNQGTLTTRRLLIDGEVPFAEADAIDFPYERDWYIRIIGEDEPYLFYLEKGRHEVSLEVVSGQMAETIRITEETVYRLNYAYRRIIMITGTNPDQFRDYYLEQEIPGLMENFAEAKEALIAEKRRLEQITGLRGAVTASFDRVILQLESFERRPYTIASRLTTYRDNIGALAGTMLSLKNQPLLIDYLLIASPDVELPKATAGFIPRTVFRLRRFFGSFSEDYSTVGEIYDKSEALEVWTGLGRDQANAIKQLIDNDFTPKTGISVNIRLLGVTAPLIQAILAGRAPDAAVFVPPLEPVNLGARGALVALSDFADFNEVASRFMPESLVTFEWQGDYYAIPVTQTFPMLFYRSDVFEELGIEPPTTWTEFDEVIAVIQRNNMRIGLPVISIQLAAAGIATNQIFDMFLYQRGGRYFNDDRSTTEFDTTQALEAFKQWTRYYTNYSFPLQYSFYTEFRTGEMPIAIEPYTTYNLLTVGAPEIQGQWDMLPVPGFVNANGSVNRSVAAAGEGCIIIKDSDKVDEAWEFHKWWTTAEVQTEFGRIVESIIGPAARYNPANVKSMSQLPWSRIEYDKLMAQFEDIVGVPQIPASYYVNRNIVYAFRNVTYYWKNPREIWFENNIESNEEITRKRIEFGLESPDALIR